MDNAHVHPPSLKNYVLLSSNSLYNVPYPNTVLLTQPMDHIENWTGD